MRTDSLHKLLKKKMTRKEFLLYIGVLFFAISGIAGVLERIGATHAHKKVSKVKSGFGTGAYGA